MAEKNRESISDSKTVSILLGIIGLLLLLMTGGLIFFLTQNNNGSPFSDSSRTVEELNGASLHYVKDYYYYEIKQPLRVSFPHGGSAGLIEIRVAFLGDADIEKVLSKHEPMIVNNLLMTISAAGADELKSKKGKNALRRRMLQETEKVLRSMNDRHHVKEIFFTAFVMQ